MIEATNLSLSLSLSLYLSIYLSIYLSLSLSVSLPREFSALLVVGRRVYRTRRRRRFGIPVFPYETNGMHKYFRRYSTEGARREDPPRRLPLARRASVPNYRVGFMNTIAATARKLAWRVTGCYCRS